MHIFLLIWTLDRSLPYIKHIILSFLHFGIWKFSDQPFKEPRALLDFSWSGHHCEANPSSISLLSSTPRSVFIKHTTMVEVGSSYLVHLWAEVPFPFIIPRHGEQLFQPLVTRKSHSNSTLQIWLVFQSSRFLKLLPVSHRSSLPEHYELRMV